MVKLSTVRFVNATQFCSRIYKQAMRNKSIIVCLFVCFAVFVFNDVNVKQFR